MTGHTTQGATGVYRPCRVCTAPIVDPFPEAWEIEMIKEGPPEGPVRSFITPHRDGCAAPYADPQPGIALRLPGTTVASLHFEIPPPVPPSGDTLWRDHGQMIPERVRADAREVARREVARPAEPVDWTGWTEVGVTAEGVSWTWAADDVGAGQAVTYAGPGRMFIKPYVSSNLDGDATEVPVIDAILDAAEVDPDDR